MKTRFLNAFASLLLLVPVLALADVPGGGVRWHTAFEVTNTEKFPDHTFYFSRLDEEEKIVQGKTYSFTRAGSPTGDWGIAIYAKNNATGAVTTKTQVGENGNKDTLTIREIKGDAIIFDKTTAAYNGDSTPSAAPSGSNLTTLLGGAAIAALVVFGAVMLKRKPQS